MRILIVAILLSGAALANEGSGGASAEITALLNEFLAHVDDPAMHERFWADDLIYVSATGVVRTKAVILGAMRGGDTPGTRGHQPGEPKSTYSAEEVKIRPLAADVAVLNFRLVQHERAEVNHFRNSGTFVRRSGRWWVVSWQATREAAPPAQR